MKKVKPAQGEYIPRTNKSRNRSVSKNQKSGVDVGAMLGKLDGEQLIELVGKVSEVAQSGFDLFTEKEKTQQVRAEVTLGIKQVEANQQTAILEYEEKISEIDTDDKKDQRRHAESMCELAGLGKKQDNENIQIMKLLGLVENESIPAEQLAQLINQIKG